MTSEEGLTARSRQAVPSGSDSWRHHAARTARRWARSFPGLLVLCSVVFAAVVVLLQRSSFISTAAADFLLNCAATMVFAIPVVIGCVVASKLPDRALTARRSLLGRTAVWLARGLWAAVIFGLGAWTGGLVGVDLSHVSASNASSTAYFYELLWMILSVVIAAGAMIGLAWLAWGLVQAERPARFRALMAILDARRRLGLPPAVRLWSESPDGSPPQSASPLPWRVAMSLHLSHTGYCVYLAGAALVLPITSLRVIDNFTDVALAVI